MAAVGGLSSTAILKDFETYCLLLKKWTKRPSLKTERSWPGVCYFTSKQVYCFCGKNDEKVLKSIERISLSSSKPKWVLMRKTEAEACYHLKAVPFNGDILVFGGYFAHSKPVTTMLTLSELGK